MTDEPSRLRLIAGLHYAKVLADERAAEKGVLSIPAVIEIVQEFERDGFDALFFADFLGLNPSRLSGTPLLPCEPLTFLSAAASATDRIGLIGTASTQFEHPYNLARQWASLDHISHGRAGWNAVTSFAGEKNYGFETLPTPEERYATGAEFIDVVDALWRSWKPGAVITDRADARYVDPDRLVNIRHRGDRFAVEEALDIPPSPQGRPVIFQAGASDSGVEFAGRFAEAVFAAAPTFEGGREFYGRVKDAAALEGRDRDCVKVFPGLHLFIGETTDAAQAAFRTGVTDESLAQVRSAVTFEFPEFDLEGLALDEPIPTERIPDLEDIATSGRRRSRAQILVEFASRRGTTFADFVQYLSHSYGHLVFIGTPESIADEMARWQREQAADGFVVLSANSYHALVSGVLPELRRRGVWTPPTGTTLRDNLGLPPLTTDTDGESE